MTERRKLTNDDLWTFNDVWNIALSPDGRRVAIVRGNRDQAKNEYHHAILLLHLDEQGRAVGEPRQLTSGVKNDDNPVWAPDSQRLLFTSNRDEGKSQLWLIDTNGGEPRKLTNMLHNVSNAAWSPDGRWIAFTASAAATDEDEVLTGHKPLDKAAQKKYEDDASIRLRTINKVWYRLDGRGLFDRRSHLFVMPAPLADEPVDAATIRRLTTGDFDHVQPQWTPDSQEISVLCNRNEDYDRSWVNDLWAIHRETGEARRLTDGSLEIASYAWSPDGRQALLAGAQHRLKEGTSNTRLYLVSRSGGELRVLTAHIDNPASVAAFAQVGGLPGPYRPQWTQDGKRAYFVVTERGCVNVHCLDIEKQTSTPVFVDQHLVFFLALLPKDRGLLLLRATELHPWEFYLLPLKGTEVGSAERLTHMYDHALSKFHWSKPERVEYASVNGDLVDGWLMRPIGAKAGVRYPLMVIVHGGPQSAFGTGMNLLFQYYAGQGFAVFFCNPHGSTSCGEAFLRQVEGDWGGLDYQDIMSGVDACIALGVADPERLVVSGYSYGGYMSMRIIGKTGRFKAAVPMAGVSNLASFVGTSDIGFWMVRQAKGYPWDPERADYYREHSPLTAAPQVTTPTLFIHPENDLRCPIEQTEQFYMALKMIGKVPVEFIRVPSSWHVGVSKPSLALARSEEMLNWFRKYVEIRPAEYEV